MKKITEKFNDINIPAELRSIFDSTITDGVKVFAKQNKLSIEDTCDLFVDKLSNVSFETYNPEMLDMNNKEDRKLMFVQGLTKITIEDTEKSDSKISRKILINQDNIGTDVAKSTLMHEIYHAALASKKLKSRNLQNVYEMGSHEVILDKGQVVSDKGHMMHEALVAKMEKEFCKKNGIKFNEKGLFASGYTNEIRTIEKLEKILGSRILPRDSLEMLKIKHGHKIEDLASSMDERDVVGSEKILDEMLDDRIKSSENDIMSKGALLARKIRRKVKTSFNNLLSGRSDEIKKLPAEIREQENVVEQEKTKNNKFQEFLSSQVNKNPTVESFEKTNTKVRTKEQNDKIY